MYSKRYILKKGATIVGEFDTAQHVGDNAQGGMYSIDSEGGAYPFVAWRHSHTHGGVVGTPYKHESDAIAAAEYFTNSRE